MHSYSYDADGNLISVDGGSTASYYYDSLNERVREAPARGTYEFVWDVMGRRVSNWAAATHAFVESNVYTDSNPIAIRTGGSTQCEHQNWLGTERLRTTYNGGVALSTLSLPWGDGHTPSGDNGDQHDFALMDRDLEDNTEHAPYRQHSTNLGRWQSPDPYSGSYDFTNPQTFNRYSYAVNDPANLSDPSGLIGDGGGLIGGPVGACVAAAGSWGSDPFADVGCGIGLFEAASFLEGLFGGHPSFHGSLKPQPSTNAGWDGNFGESLGIPTTIPRGNFGLALAFGLPQQGCEFGACGESLTETPINENKTLQQKIAELESEGIFVGPLETKFSPFHKGQITLRDNNWFCSQHVTLDQGSGQDGRPVTGSSHYDLVNPWFNIPLSTLSHTLYDLIPDKIEDHFPSFPTGSDLCKYF